VHTVTVTLADGGIENSQKVRIGFDSGFARTALGAFTCTTGASNNYQSTATEIHADSGQLSLPGHPDGDQHLDQPE